MIGANGFEPSTSWFRTRRASLAALRPDRLPHLLSCISSHFFNGQIFRFGRSCALLTNSLMSIRRSTAVATLLSLPCNVWR